MSDNTLATIQIEGDKYGETVSVVEYNGKLQLIAGNESKDGEKHYFQWAFPQTSERVPGPKAIPVKCTLGDPKEAVRVLGAVLKVVEHHVNGQDQAKTDPADEQRKGYEGIPTSKIPF